MGKVEKITRNAKAKVVAADNTETAAPAADRVARRAKRLEKLAKASTVTFTVEPSVRQFMDAQAKAAGMNLTHYMQQMVETHVIQSAPADDALGQRLAAKRKVISDVVARAKKMDEAGQFDDHFILKVVQDIAKDDDFAAQYELASTGGAQAGSRAASRARVSLNQQIGRVIKKAVGARSKRTEGGKIARAQVQDAMISTYTLLDKPA
ncbi:hypothetical protein [Pseudosulfitobacter pseudonitzschiae]|uniref:hypothetical protein n=1 Tax=Pseudosulfitobacter pseudonitzschiae TaxID=1402135 RepID=UPI001AFAB5A8|nr:hypothetical protein [Pseudosulfitobacter pseudonitzschiae]MBM1815379.1 hypothetical protein [Pseudosulfitobacter pseudonitzschiae]MBM1832370.1 hypothetical protein [Pseudosulfitobacter pseudonitzschiae]MBM1837238.1 hypothetical protein [Pseudosulfitobacter pseudonitzschiae]MBM1842084.1 hypothetical protein [Pseudosulfitobacter pseudonitzschiae]MBM1846952.1 hypothetical protein [Pseudosulfitobacter pseudonitzschiae]